MDLNSIPKQIQREVGIYVPVQPSCLLVIQKFGHYKIHKEGENVFPYLLTEGTLLKPGESCQVQRLVTGRKSTIIEDVVVNENGKPVIYDVKKYFANQQYQLLYERGFGNYAYEIIGACGPSYAVIAVEYAYEFHNAVTVKLNFRDNGTVCRVIDDIFNEITGDAESNFEKIKNKLQVLGLPVPEAKNFYSIKMILIGAKAAISFGLPQKIKKNAC
ncbi:MAG: hypothetical protein AAB657_02070 [Patescibacteria group bacterium]